MDDAFVELTEADDALFDSFWLPLYRTAFPDDERIPEGEHRESAVADGMHILAGFANGQPVSIARYDEFTAAPDLRCAYLMYMAVDESAVSHGHGQLLFREIVDRLSTGTVSARLLLFEVQRPDVASDTRPHQSAVRRINFYLGQGASILDGIDYVQHVPGQPGVPMFIMARPLVAEVSAEDVFTAARTLFGDDVTPTGTLVLRP